MRRLLSVGIALCIATLIGVRSAAASCPPDSTIADHVFGGGLCLIAKTYGAETGGNAPVLAIVVHGDISAGGPATYHAHVAAALARPGVVAVALWRPGYRDGEGRKSEGDMLGRLDNYTPANIAAIGGAIEALRTHYRASRVVYIGHSGGAAIGGVLIGKRHELIDIAVLISCPCDIARWRSERWRDEWTRSESPSLLVPHVRPGTRVLAITGADDPNTLPVIAEDYVKSLADRGVDARFVLIAGAHGFSTVEAGVMPLLLDAVSTKAR